MSPQQIKISIPISFKQVVDIVKQLSPAEKQELSKVLRAGQCDNEMVIPEEHKQIVRKRIKKYKSYPDNYLSWNDIEQKIAKRK